MSGMRKYAAVPRDFISRNLRNLAFATAKTPDIENLPVKSRAAAKGSRLHPPSAKGVESRGGVGKGATVKATVSATVKTGGYFAKDAKNPRRGTETIS